TCALPIYKKVGHGKNFFHRLQLSEEPHVFGNFKFAAHDFGTYTLGSITNHQQLSGNFLPDPGKDPKHIVYTFYLSEVRDVHDERLAVRTDGLLEVILFHFAKLLHIDEVRYHFYLLSDLKMLKRLPLQVFRHCGYTV